MQSCVFHITQPAFAGKLVAVNRQNLFTLMQISTVQQHEKTIHLFNGNQQSGAIIKTDQQHVRVVMVEGQGHVLKVIGAAQETDAGIRFAWCGIRVEGSN